MSPAGTVARLRRTALAAVALAFAVCMLQATAHPLGGAADPAIFGGLYTAGWAIAGVMCLWRAAAIPQERLTWAALGGALNLSAVANALFSLNWFAHWPLATVASFTWIAAYGLGFVALTTLVRSRVHGVSMVAWLDGIVGAFVIESFTALAFLHSVEVRIEQGSVASAAYLAFPVLDVVLVTLVAAAAAHTRWQLRGWKAIGTGCLVMAVGDGANVGNVVRGALSPVNVANVVTLAAVLFFAYAAWQPIPPRPVARRPWPLVPAVFGGTALGALLLSTVGMENHIAAALAAIAMAAVILRFALTLAANERMLEAARVAAATDDLTGLPNRRTLLEDLESACRSAALDRPRTLMLFDLDGFKHYNDTLGHQHGDELLVELGRRLRAAVDGFATVYRMGGDEFCLLTHADPPVPGRGRAAQRAVTALQAACEGLPVGASAGLAVVPTEADTSAEALRVADERMYADKRRKRGSLPAPATGVALAGAA